MGFKSISLNEDTLYEAKAYNGCKFQTTADYAIFFNGFDAIQGNSCGSGQRHANKECAELP